MVVKKQHVAQFIVFIDNSLQNTVSFINNNNGYYYDWFVCFSRVVLRHVLPAEFWEFLRFRRFLEVCWIWWSSTGPDRDPSTATRRSSV